VGNKIVAYRVLMEKHEIKRQFDGPRNEWGDKN
jgi:hypothetical protein